MNAALGLPRTLAYGALGLPLAFAALPLYVHLAPFYAATVPLALLGGILLALRFLDAVVDPLIGALLDRFPHPRTLVALSLPLVGAGWVGLFTPQNAWPAALWLTVMLALTTLGYSLATVVHTAWGARLSAAPPDRARLFAAREGLGLVGVVLAAALPAVLAANLGDGLARMGLIFLALLFAFGALTLLATPAMPGGTRTVRVRQFLQPFANPAFARFVPGYLLNAVASALPATLVIFFIDDVLQLAPYNGLFLALYFLAGAAGLPLWLALARRIGALEAWMVSMGLAVITFAGAFWLGSGDLAAYALVCLASGLALGADLALPPTLVAGMVDADAVPQPGAYYGLMSFFSKLALALAAGLALPLLDLAGYAPGGGNLLALAVTYALLPCVLKLGALAWFWQLRAPPALKGNLPC